MPRKTYPVPKPTFESSDGSRGARMAEKNQKPPMSCLDELMAAGKAFYQRNWILGTAGNFSAVVSRMPFQLVVTKSHAHRGTLSSADFVKLDHCGHAFDGQPAPAESPIHACIISDRGAGAVLQTHSVWSTVLADIYAPSAGIELEGFEVLKGLSRAPSRHHREWVPILDSSEDYPSVARAIVDVLKAHPEVHAILLRKHGLYTWGTTIEEAVRHVEILELLFEVVVRKLHIFTQADLKEIRGPSM